MSCNFVHADLKAFSDNELSPLRRVLVRRHLAGCAECARELQEMKSITNAMQSGESDEPLSEKLRSQILNRISSEPRPADQAASTRPEARRAWRFGPALIATFSVAAVVAGFLAMHPIERLSVTNSASLQSASAPSVPQAIDQVKAIEPAQTKPSQAQAVIRPSSLPNLPMSEADGRNSVPTGATVAPQAVAPAPSNGLPTNTPVAAAGNSNAAPAESEPRQMPMLAAPALPSSAASSQTSPGSVYTFSRSAAPTAPQAGPMIASPPVQVQLTVPQTVVAGRPAAMAASPQLEINGNGPAVVRQVHREGRIVIQAIDAGTCSASISRIAVQAGGNAAPGIWLKDNAGDMTSLFSVSVPSLQFETVVGQIAKLGNVVEKSVTATDLTLAVNNANQTVSSLEAQLSQAKTPQTALGQASTDASQPNATKLQAKLAQAQAQLQQLEQQASTAEIFIKITQTANPAPTPDTQR